MSPATGLDRVTQFPQGNAYKEEMTQNPQSSPAAATPHRLWGVGLQPQICRLPTPVGCGRPTAISLFLTCHQPFKNAFYIMTGVYVNATEKSLCNTYLYYVWFHFLLYSMLLKKKKKSWW